MNTLSYVLSGLLCGLSVASMLGYWLFPRKSNSLRIFAAGCIVTAGLAFALPHIGWVIVILGASLLLHLISSFKKLPFRLSLIAAQVATLLGALQVVAVPSLLLWLAWPVLLIIAFFGFIYDTLKDVHW